MEDLKEKNEGEKPLEELEDEYDAALGEAAYNEYVKDGKKSRPIAELREELGL